MKATLYRLVYRVIGTAFLMVAVISILMMFGFFTEIAQAFYSHEVHIVQEFGCALAFIGLVVWWHSFHLSRGKTMHCLLVIFFALFSGVHWIDFLKDNVPLQSALINSVPMLLLGVMYYFYDFERRL